MAETVTGTNGNNTLMFVGQTGQYDATLVNPYSGVSVTVNDVKNIGTHSYDGLGGTDTISLTNAGDVLVAFGADGIIIKNVERIVAGAGGDVISIASSGHSYGDILIDGGVGGDILWSNNGNDTINGGAGDDLIDGGGGNDLINAGDDDDSIYGGFGNDRILGGAGNDTIYGGNNSYYIYLVKSFADTRALPVLKEGVNIVNLPEPADPSLGVINGNLSVNFDATATITFRDGFAGYNNTLGAYAIAANGEIIDARIYWGNVKTAGIDTPHIVDLPTGEDGGDFGFFIISNGFNVNGGYGGLDIADEGVLRFIYNYGLAGERAATVYDNGANISVVYDDGVTERVLNGYVYHTTERDGSTMLNSDGFTHAVSGLADENNPYVLRIGFEDLPNLGDADFEDVLFDFNVNPFVVDISEPGSDILIGGAGNDLMYGEGGNDLIIMGDGADQAWGGTGRDIFAFDIFDDAPDIIHDFKTGPSGDTLNIADILTNYDPVDDVISDFVRLTQSGGNTLVEVMKGGDFEHLVTLIGVSGVDLATMIVNGNIEAEQSIVL